MHSEIPIKVTAWVDEGIVPLVAALNEFDGVITVDSCEADERGEAYVYFKVRGEPDATVLFAARLAHALAGNGIVSEYCLRVEWIDGSDEPMAQIVTAPALVKTLADVLISVK